MALMIGSRWNGRETAGDGPKSLSQRYGFDAAQIICLPVRLRSSMDVSFRPHVGHSSADGNAAKADIAKPSVIDLALVLFCHSVVAC